jgi:hypothetical protein
LIGGFTVTFCPCRYVRFRAGAPTTAKFTPVGEVALPHGQIRWHKWKTQSISYTQCATKGSKDQQWLSSI